MLCYKLLVPSNLMYNWKFFFILGWSKELYNIMCIYLILKEQSHCLCTHTGRILAVSIQNITLHRVCARSPCNSTFKLYTIIIIIILHTYINNRFCLT